MANDFNKPKKASKIEELPIETRRLIFWIVVIIMVIVVCGLWLFSLQYSLKHIQLADTQQNNNFEQLQNDLKKIMENTASGINDIKDQLNQAEVAPTSTPADLQPASSTPEIDQEPVLPN